MMNFSWQQLENGHIKITVKTPVVKIGTLHRLTSAIFAMELDIVSGEVNTVQDGDEIYSNDEFILRPVVSLRNNAEISARLGMLMETMLHENENPDVVLEAEEVSPPERLQFFDAAPELVFETDEESNSTHFYIEATNRTGLLFHLTRLLSRLGVNILKASIYTNDENQIQDTFFLQYEGKPLTREISNKISSAITEY